MYDLYNNPLILPLFGKSDHNSVLCRPCVVSSDLYKPQQTEIATRNMGHNEHCLFVNALSKVDWN